MAEHKIVWLGLPQHTDLKHGVPVFADLSIVGEEIWDKHQLSAVELEPSDEPEPITPPGLAYALTSKLRVLPSGDAVERMETHGQIYIEKQNGFKATTNQPGLTVIRYPQDLAVHYGAFTLPGETPRLYYIVRQLEVAGLNTSLNQRELVGVGVGGGDIQNKPYTPLEEEYLRRLLRDPRIPHQV